MTDRFGELFTPEWRAAHARRGDEILANLEALDTGPDYARTVAWAARAQAHYAAANVTAKPVPRPVNERLETR